MTKFARLLESDIHCIQDAVDAYTAKEYKQMTLIIDKISENNWSGSGYYFEGLKQEFENFADHEYDYEIYAGMVFEYFAQKEESESQRQRDFLLKFAKWLITEEKTIPDDENNEKILIDDFLEDIHDNT